MRTDNYTHRHAIEQWKHYPIDQSGYVVDENPYSNKSVIRVIQEIRASEIKVALNQGIEMSEFMVQVLPCVEVCEMDRNECPCAPASGCYWLKTKCEIPRFIKMISVTGIVANSESPRFTFIKWDRFQYLPFARSKSMQKGLYWTIKDSGGDGPHLYLYGDRFLEAVAISAIWEDPMTVEAYPKCGETDIEAMCNPLDIDFYTDAWMRDTIISRAWQKLLPVRQLAGLDMQNDDTFANNPSRTQS
jgi:hypothetical protein